MEVVGLPKDRVTIRAFRKVLKRFRWQHHIHPQHWKLLRVEWRDLVVVRGCRKLVALSQWIITGVGDNDRGVIKQASRSGW